MRNLSRNDLASATRFASIGLRWPGGDEAVQALAAGKDLRGPEKGVDVPQSPGRVPDVRLEEMTGVAVALVSIGRRVDEVLEEVRPAPFQPPTHR